MKTIHHLQKKLKGIQSNGKTSHVQGLEESMLSYPYHLTWFSMCKYQNNHDILHRSRQILLKFLWKHQQKTQNGQSNLEKMKAKLETSYYWPEKKKKLHVYFHLLETRRKREGGGNKNKRLWSSLCWLLVTLPDTSQPEARSLEFHLVVGAVLQPNLVTS